MVAPTLPAAPPPPARAHSSMPCLTAPASYAHPAAPSGPKRIDTTRPLVLIAAALVHAAGCHACAHHQPTLSNGRRNEALPRPLGRRKPAPCCGTEAPWKLAAEVCSEPEFLGLPAPEALTSAALWRSVLPVAPGALALWVGLSALHSAQEIIVIPGVETDV